MRNRASLGIDIRQWEKRVESESRRESLQLEVRLFIYKSTHNAPTNNTRDWKWYNISRVARIDTLPIVGFQPRSMGHETDKPAVQSSHILLFRTGYFIQLNTEDEVEDVEKTLRRKVPVLARLDKGVFAWVGHGGRRSRAAVSSRSTNAARTLEFAGGLFMEGSCNLHSTSGSSLGGDCGFLAAKASD